MKVKFCKKCTISNYRPSSTVEILNDGRKKEYIQFDENGVCVACNYWDYRKTINWEEKEKDLLKLLDKHRGKGKCGYDVILPSSSGKDSMYVAHMLKHKYGINPLIVTASPHIWTDIGWKNYQSLIKISDCVLFNGNVELRRLLTKLSFVNLCHPFQSWIILQKSIGASFAVRYGVDLVFYGEDGRMYGNDSNNFKGKMDHNYYSAEIEPENVMLGGLKIEEILEKYKQFKMSDFVPYLPLKQEDVKDIEVHYFADYHKWSPQSNFYYASQNCGFLPNSERTPGSYSKYSSIDDLAVDIQHYFTTLIKFGIGRATYDSSQEIRDEIITREEGVELIKKYDTEIPPKKYLKQFLDYIDITEDEYWQVIEKFRNNNLWEKVNNEWKLKYIID